MHRLVRVITPRDREICRLLDHHRTLTVHQLHEAFFDSPRCARQRLTTLYRLDVIDRFRPYRDKGSAPFHYVLGNMGALLRGLERGDDPNTIRRDPAMLRMAFSRHLDHLVETNSFFTSLMATARRSDGEAELVEWWSERRCAKAMGGVVYPDGYGVWRQGTRTVEFCVEIDRGTEAHGVVKAKLDGYRRLQAATQVKRWVLFVLPTPRREVEIRRALVSPKIAVATTVAGQSSADAIWQPLGGTGERLRLGELPSPDWTYTRH